MKFYFAPMEGITGYVYRNVYHRHFGEHIDQYYAPFIFADQCKGFKMRDHRDLTMENNPGLKLIPQVLTNDPDDFNHTARKIQALGYQEVNLNLGCPAPTVVSKNRGSGLLAHRDKLHQLMEGIFKAPVIDISVKTRLGKTDPEAFYEIMDIYNQYPIKELTIHPRIQTDMYRNKPNMPMFKAALETATMPVCYNGDLFTQANFNTFTAEFPEIQSVMLGRGLLANPDLIAAIKNDRKTDHSKLRAFHDDLFAAYCEVLTDERRVLFRMKELWFYMKDTFENSEVHIAAIRKSECFVDYEKPVYEIFNNAC